MMRTSAKRHHDISCGHRVVGHEGKCRFLHGHNYRIEFECVAGTWGGIGPIVYADESLDVVGRVIDFSVIKARLCQWLEENWDHRFLVWEKDPLKDALLDLDELAGEANQIAGHVGVVVVPFNPTAENIARHLLTVVAPAQLAGTGIVVAHVDVEETRKCSAAVAA